ncbi:MAG TPA: ribonuclease Z [Saprospiraceae bacterium]|nr:ribonuclease Z [Saprospiraceae bacterium]
MNFEVCILGCNGAVPQKGKYPSCQYVRIDTFHCLVDCGEGAQFQMVNLGVPKHRIEHIFISHLHGDHIFGLIGLITSYLLAGRTKALDIFSPQGLEEIIKIQLQANGKFDMPFELRFHVIDTTTPGLIFENDILEVISIPLKHRIPTSGFLFREKQRTPNIDKHKLEEYQLERAEILKLKAGESVQNRHGKHILPQDVLKAPLPKRSYAYCSDTMYAPENIPILKGVNLLYHESTFLQVDEATALATNHSTAQQAASIAHDAEVGLLLLGHFSARYANRQYFIDEASQVFPNVFLASEGMVAKLEILDNKITTRLSNPA